MVPLHRVQAEARQPLQPTAASLRDIVYPRTTVFTAVQPVQQLAGGDVLEDTKRIQPDRKVQDWEVAASPELYSSVLLTGRGWAEARATAMEALGKWREVDAVSSLHLVPPRRGAAASVEAAMAAIRTGWAKVRGPGLACQAQLVCQLWEWEMVGVAPPGSWMGTS